MTQQYGVDYGYRYLAVVTNPLPNPASKKSGGRLSGSRQLPQIKLQQLKQVFDLCQG